ncbi:hypothetical protein PIB30_017817 [Stylosanthes scabra]|uniref:Type 2 DNA topoisomerase 6 subunit B-like n=1 Tax=Stylosanthes scabra TaxID=79078 RepID=A0ABU6V5X9_9FABA|nr:hypothetical protein [Stylosanthes scabra]
MEFSSVQNLSLHVSFAFFSSLRILISSAFQRCRLSEQICRISVILARSSSSSLRVSIADTGIGSCLEEFQALKFSSKDDTDHWGSLTFGSKPTGSEVCLSSSVSIDLLVAEIHDFLQKMMILSIPNVATRLVAEDCDVPGSRYEKVFLPNGDKELPISALNIDLLESGFEDYVLRHGNTLSNKCLCCFPNWEQLKVGIGVACSNENHQQNELVMEVVIIISNMSVDNTECFRKHGDKTEVLYFEDFSPGTISKSFMKALKGIDWKSYGLKLREIVQQDGFTLLEWENLARDTHIDITVITGPRKKSQIDRNLVKRAVKLSLDDLKEKHSGVFLSSRAVQIRSYAPDLAKTIAGLILSSSDLDFQGECFSLLGLQSQVVGTENMENCIMERIVSVIEMNDKKPHKTIVAPSLFEDDRSQELEFEVNDMEEGI